MIINVVRAVFIHISFYKTLLWRPVYFETSEKIQVIVVNYSNT